MEDKLRFFINATEYTADITDGQNELAEKVSFDFEERRFLLEIDGELTLNGQGYDFLHAQYIGNFDQNIPCTIVLFNDATNAYETAWNGLIFLTDCIFDLYKKEVKIQIVDNSYFAKIENNKNIKFVIGVDNSKNDVDVSSRISFTNFRVRSSLTNGLATPGVQKTVSALSHYQAMDALVAYMTDGDLQFVSNSLSPFTNSDSDQETGFLIRGQALRNAIAAGNNGSEISFADLWADLSKLYNLVYFIEKNSSGQLALRVETVDFIRQSSITDLTELEVGVQESTNTELLYGSILAGSKEEDLTGFVPFAPFRYQFQESFQIRSVTNLDRELNLRMETLITDTSLIFAQQSSSSEDNDNEVYYVIGYDDGTGYQGKVENIGASFWVYNEPINNVSVIVNNLTGLPGSVFKFYQNLAGVLLDFLANKNSGFVTVNGLQGYKFASTAINGVNWNDTTTGIFIGSPPTPTVNDEFKAQFDNDSVSPGFDAGNNYDASTTFNYVVPATSFASFQTLLRVFVDYNVVEFFPKIQVKIYHTDSLNNVLNTVDSGVLFVDGNTAPNFLDIFLASPYWSLNSGDIVFVAITCTDETGPGYPGGGFADYYLMEESYFRTINNDLGGGEIAQVDTGNSFLRRNQMTGDVSLQKWNEIKLSPFNKMLYRVAGNGESRNGWIKEFSRKLATGEFEGETMLNLRKPESDAN